MKSFSPFSALACFFSAVALTCSAADKEPLAVEVQALNQILPGMVEGKVDYDMTAGTATGTNGVFVRYGDAVLTADNAAVDVKSGEVIADGHVRIESADQLWVGDHIRYNFKTRQMQSEQFRSGKSPVFTGGSELTGDASNKVYTATSAYVTTDDVSEPAYTVRASRIKVMPGEYVQMYNAVVYVAGSKIPVFYFPFYQRNLGVRANNFTITPGYRSRYGGYLLNTYNWYLGDAADGKVHLDYRSKRGVGIGPDLNFHLDRWGELALKYYYLNDENPNSGTNNLPQYGKIPENRQRVYAGWQATPATNFNLKALVNYQSDPLVLHDYFEGAYRNNPQPYTFIEANKYWDNWSLDALATPRVKDFFSQIERLPDVKLTGFRQQILDTPFYYDSESSAGWYRKYVANMTNGFYPQTTGSYTDSAARADTYHQITLPWMFFHWLNVAPRVGGRFSYYSARADSFTNSTQDTFRGVFNTGMRTSFKASRLWTDATNSFLEIDGLRHIIEPSADYVFVPHNSTPIPELPQFDGQNPSLLLDPISFPDYNSIDAIDAQNVIRFGLRNVLQTKRGGQMDDLVNWNLLMDLRLDPEHGQSRLNDLYSQLRFRPRHWLTAESQMRFDTESGEMNLAYHQLTFSPGDRWSWGLGHWYLRGGDWGNGSWQERDFINSTMFFRVNNNWGFRATHNFNAKDGRLQDQFYTVYRDLRSMTAALTFRVVNEQGRTPDYTIAFTLSLKASPSFGVGEDTVNPYRLVGE